MIIPQISNNCNALVFIESCQQHQYRIMGLLCTRRVTLDILLIPEFLKKGTIKNEIRDSLVQCDSYLTKPYDIGS